MLKKSLCLAVSLLSCVLFAAEYRAVSLRPGVTQLLNDNGEWPNVSGRGLAVLPAHVARVRKIFDLTKLPEGTLQSAQKAALQVHIGIVDYSLKKGAANGLAEEFVIAINGHEMVFPTGDARFPSRGIPVKKTDGSDNSGLGAGQTEKQLHGWANVEFPVAWIKDGKMTVEIFKKRSTPSDDYVMIGWDITVPNGNSYYTVNNGKEWSLGNGAQPAGMGEYLMRLIVSDNPEEKFELPKPPKLTVAKDKK